MKTLRSLLWQIPSSSMFFGFLIILASGTLGQMTSLKTSISVSPNEVDTTPSALLPPTESPSPNITTKHPVSDISSKTHPVSKSLVTRSYHKEATPKSRLPLEQHPTSKHSEPLITTEETEKAMSVQTKPTDATTDSHTSKPETTKTVATIPHTVEATKAAATIPHAMEATKAVGKPAITVEELTPYSTTAATVGNTNIHPRGRKGEKEMSTPGQRVQEDPTPPDNSSRRPETQSTAETSTTKASVADTTVTASPARPTVGARDSDHEVTESPSQVRRGTMVAIVLSVLLVLILLVAFLLCWRRRRHSGSTSFKTAGWAGQAALLDDATLDKEVEQGALTAGEGEARRATLTTFFGKRQSRVSSVAMEEIVKAESGDIEEAQPLTDGNASRVSSLEGSGEANGKLPEPTVQCSQEIEFPPPPPADQEQPLLTQPE